MKFIIGVQWGWENRNPRAHHSNFLLFVFHVCHAVVSVHCSLVVTCWERADLFAVLYVMFSCVFVTFLCVWYLIVSIPDLCLLPYFAEFPTERLTRRLVFPVDTEQQR